ncbi:histamine N-methyltransferase B-like [Diadema antillarum]|uniref:histamine N-methyltransferase B-like n=1 Tax=Diadema antillarum TaxID=105358 RepID=UPI003A8C0CE7
MAQFASSPEWQTTLRTLIPLQDDVQRYKDVYLTAFFKISEKEMLFDVITQNFDATVMSQLIDRFPVGKVFNVLGVGIGEGKHELYFLEGLGKDCNRLSFTAVEPSSAMLQAFERNVATSGVSEKTTLQLLACTLSQFFNSRTPIDTKFKLISAIHSIYYTGDLEITFHQLTSLLHDNGVLIIVVSDSNLPITTNFCLKTLTGVKEELMITAQRVIMLAKRHGFEVQKISIPLSLDVTELFDESSEFGSKLLDFLTSTSHFRRSVPSKISSAVTSFYRSLAKESEKGRFELSADNAMLIIKKGCYFHNWFGLVREDILSFGFVTVGIVLSNLKGTKGNICML